MSCACAASLGLQGASVCQGPAIGHILRHSITRRRCNDSTQKPSDKAAPARGGAFDWRGGWLCRWSAKSVRVHRCHFASCQTSSPSIAPPGLANTDRRPCSRSPAGPISAATAATMAAASGARAIVIEAGFSACTLSATASDSATTWIGARQSSCATCVHHQRGRARREQRQDHRISMPAKARLRFGGRAVQPLVGRRTTEIVSIPAEIKCSADRARAVFAPHEQQRALAALAPVPTPPDRWHHHRLTVAANPAAERPGGALADAIGRCGSVARAEAVQRRPQRFPRRRSRRKRPVRQSRVSGIRAPSAAKSRPGFRQAPQ